MIERGEFRADLFYRLSVVPITLPPLRERGSDIQLLAQLILKNILKRRKLGAVEISLSAMDLILQHSWPGNVRELQNELERALIIAGERSAILEPSHFSISVNPAVALKNQTRSYSQTIEELPNSLTHNLPSLSSDRLLSGVENLQDAFKIVEQVMIRNALKRTNGNKSEAARILGISRSTLIAKVQEFEI
jgi:transcriptional regulator with PAS, ATPase and Fis domain